MYGPNKVEHFTTLGQNGLPITNTLAYWALTKVTQKMKCCECTIIIYYIGVFLDKLTNTFQFGHAYPLFI